jgi:hypothetical protein
VTAVAGWAESEQARLAELERCCQAVLRQAAEANNAVMVLRAVDRLLLISERRSAVGPVTAAGVTESAVAADVGVLPEKLRMSASARLAGLLARRLDGGVNAGDLTAVARELRITLSELAALAPPEAEGSTVDELRARRAERAAAEG